MIFRTLGLLAALAMLASLFLPWTVAQFGPPLVPFDGIKALLDLDPDLRAQLFQTMPPAEIATFGLSFIAALLFLLTGTSSRLLAILAGVLPFATVGILFVRAENAASSLGNLPSFDAPNFSQQLSEFYDIAGPGMTLWFGSAAFFLLLGLLFSPPHGR